MQPKRIYEPVKLSDELPPIEEHVPAKARYTWVDFIRYKQDNNAEFLSGVGAIEWLKESTDKFILNKEELVELIKETWVTAVRNTMKGLTTDLIGEDCPDLEEFLKSKYLNLPS